MRNAPSAEHAGTDSSPTLGERRVKRVRRVRAGALAYFALFLVFVIWPGALLFNRPLPLILGLPFNMAVIAAWVAFGSVVLFALDRSERRHATEGRADDEQRPADEPIDSTPREVR